MKPETALKVLEELKDFLERGAVIKRHDPEMPVFTEMENGRVDSNLDVSFVIPTKCPRCRGIGSVDPGGFTGLETCPACNGTGELLQ